MPALEPVAALRVVAARDALDGARWPGSDVDVLRTAPDEALGLGATAVEVNDPDAIIETESGFVVALLGRDELQVLAAHTDWALPTEIGVLAQGKVAGVPAKVVGGTPTLLVTNAAYADELRRRLGW